MKVKEKSSDAIPALAQEMHTIWLEETAGQVATPGLTTHFAHKLLEALRTFFQNSIEKWRLYCRSVASSKFLMGQGRGFKAWLIWAVRGDVVAKIRAGAYGITSFQDIDETPEEDFGQKADALVETLTHSAEMRQKLTVIKDKLTPRTFITWFNQCRIEEGEGGIPQLRVRGSFCHDYIRDTFGEILASLGLRLGLEVSGHKGE